LLGLISAGKLEPRRLIGRQIALSEAPQALAEMSNFAHVGIAVIDRM
jgi:alcohol dehydrogenase